MLDVDPFHDGERKAQALAGAGDVARWAASYIRPSMPPQHRTFFAQLPFLVLAGADDNGRHWVTLLEGPDGFLASPNAETLTVNPTPAIQDPLADALMKGTEIGLLGIELNTQRRNRLSGRFRRQGAGGYAVDVRQSFGNCPQYIHERNWQRVSRKEAPSAVHSTFLSDEQVSRIRAADTLFLGTGQQKNDEHASNGFDASHRGGAPGFVQVLDATRLRIPDYAGNNFFNTIGNLLENPAIGLVFVDFETGGLLHLSGRASVDWDATDSEDPSAQRMIDVTIDAVVERPTALSLRWHCDDAGQRDLVVTRKMVEAKGITSFYLSATDGSPLAPFEAGQHLPVKLDIPGQHEPVDRSYSLSGSPDAGTYRLSVKREAQGMASTFLHDSVEVGSRIATLAPAGDFKVPCDDCPLVLASAGVGLTPMLSMLHQVGSRSVAHPVWYVHGARNGAYHAFRSEVDALVATHPNLKKHICYSRPLESDSPGVDYDHVGRIEAQTFLDLNAGLSAHYMLCGPTPWIATVRANLEAAGVPEDHIHFETFGPTG